MTERREPADARTASPAATTHPQPRPTHGHQPLPLDNRLSIGATMQSPGRRQPGYSYATRPSENCRAWPFLCVRTTTATGSRRRLPTYVRSRAAIGRSTTVSSDPFVHRSHGQIIFRRPPTKRPVGSDRRALRMAREQALLDLLLAISGFLALFAACPPFVFARAFARHRRRGCSRLVAVTRAALSASS